MTDRRHPPSCTRQRMENTINDDIRSNRAPAHDVLLLTIKQAPQMLNVGRTTAYELIAAGDLEVVHIGRAARVPVSAVHEFVTARRAGEVRPRRGGTRGADRAS